MDLCFCVYGYVRLCVFGRTSLCADMAMLGIVLYYVEHVFYTIILNAKISG